MIVGEGYEDDITIDNIRGTSKQGTDFIEENILEVLDADDNSIHLNFGDCPIGRLNQLTFTITNHSSTEPYRFSWGTHPNIVFIPSVGHIHPRCSKDIIAEFKAQEPVSFQKVAVPVKIAKITFPQPLAHVADWDDRMRVVRWVAPSTKRKSSYVEDDRITSPSKGKKESKKATEKEKVEEKLVQKAVEEKKVKVIETEPEPSYTAMEDTQRDIEIKASATSDYTSFSCDCEEIVFKDTLMFQNRTYRFNVYNNGNIILDYQWILNGTFYECFFNCFSIRLLTKI